MATASDRVTEIATEAAARGHPEISDMLRPAASEFLRASESLLKAALADLWDDCRPEAEAWLRQVGEYEAKILLHGETEHTALTRKFLEAGTAAVVRRMKGRSEEAGKEVLEGIWAALKGLLSAIAATAAAAAMEKLKGK